MINDIINEKNGNFLLDLTSEKNPIINVKKNVNITIDLLINDDTNLFIFKYSKPRYGINLLEFYHHCENGEKVK